MINIEDIDSNLQKIVQKHWYLQHWIYYNWKIDDYENIHIVNPLYLIICKIDGFIEEKNETKYLVFDSAELRSIKLHSKYENKEVLKIHRTLGWD